MFPHFQGNISRSQPRFFGLMFPWDVFLSQTARSMLTAPTYELCCQVPLVGASTQREDQVECCAALEGIFFGGLVVGPIVTIQVSMLILTPPSTSCP
jgi:hypothetical protein